MLKIASACVGCRGRIAPSQRLAMSPAYDRCTIGTSSNNQIPFRLHPLHPSHLVKSLFPSSQMFPLPRKLFPNNPVSLSSFQPSSFNHPPFLSFSPLPHTPLTSLPPYLACLTTNSDQAPIRHIPSSKTPQKHPCRRAHPSTRAQQPRQRKGEATNLQRNNSTNSVPA